MSFGRLTQIQKKKDSGGRGEKERVTRKKEGKERGTRVFGWTLGEAHKSRKGAIATKTVQVRF